MRTRHPLTVTDPETGRTWPIPAGGSDTPPADDPGDGDGTGDDDGQDDGADDDDGGDGDGTPRRDRTQPASDPEQLRADLARERRRRQEREQELAALRQQTESDAERREREIREQAQAPAIRALRVTAVESAASAAGFHDPQDAAALVRLDAIDVDLDAEIPTADRDAAARLVAELAEAKPHLIRAEPDDRETRDERGGSDTRGSGSGNGQRDPDRSFMGALQSARRR